MIKAFVFGKFFPFHKGHEAMINFALRKCDFLNILICCSEKEKMPGSKRKAWIENAFTGVDNIDVQVFNYNESELPNTSRSSKEVSALWSKVFKQLLPDVSLLITSEQYGEYVAGIMNIRHIAFDMDKKIFPVSATAVRKDIFNNWNFLPDAVKTDLAIKVVILGTESTGKTTLTERLAKHFDCNYVPEAGRDIIANSNSFDIEDLQLVALEHSRQIESAVKGFSPFIIIDTDLHITQSYARFALGKDLNIHKDMCTANSANLYLYLNNDVPYVQDGTRLSEPQRNLLDISHRQILAENRVAIVEIKGSWDERFRKAVEEIEKLKQELSNSGDSVSFVGND